MVTSFVKKNYVYICALVFILAFSILYSFTSFNITAELPYLSWYDLFHIVEHYYDGNLSFQEFFIPYSSHGMFGYCVLTLINASVFSYHTSFDVVFNIILVIVTSCLMAWFFLSLTKGTNPIAQILGLFCIILICCNPVQLSSGGMDTQVRTGLCFVLPMCWFINNCLLHNEKKKISFWIFYSLTNLFLINIFGTLYTFALFPPLVIAIVVKSILQKKVSLNSILSFLIFLFCIVLYYIEYFIIGYTSGGGHEGIDLIINNFISVFTNFGNFCLGLFGFLGVGLFGREVLRGVMNFSDSAFVVMGIISFVLFIASFVLYCKKKMYKESVFPVLCISFTLFEYVLVYLGRARDWTWFYSEWYVVNSKFYYFGLILLITMVVRQFDFAVIKKMTLNTGLCVLSCLTFSIPSFIGMSALLYSAPYMKTYFENKQDYLFFTDPDIVPIDESGLTPLLISYDNNLEMVSYLRKYNLSVYHDTSITTNFLTSEKTLNVYDIEDGHRWLNQKSILIMNSGETGTLNFEGYIPFEEYVDGNGLTFYINNEKKFYQPLEGQYVNISFSDTGYINETVELRIETNYLLPHSNGDLRDLGIFALNLFFN